MTSLIVSFIVLALVIVLAGTFLTHYADHLAEHTGMGRSLAGLVLLAAATSLPELAVNCRAAWIPAEDMILGNTLGSSLYNLLILAILDLGRRARGRMLSPVAAAHSLSATTSIVLTGIAGLFLVLPPSLAVGGVGIGTILIGCSYVIFLRLIFFDHQYAAQQGMVDDDHDATTAKRPGFAKCVIGYVVLTSIVFAAASRLVPVADQLAEATGLGRTFVGTTMVALATSLPEIVTTLEAVRLGSLELAVGNIFGSNAFNMVVLLPADIMYRQGSLLPACGHVHLVTAFSVIIVTSLAMSGMLYRPRKKYWIVEPDAMLVALIIVTALGLVFLVEQGSMSLAH